jgi:hypothetical protein
MNSNSYPGPDRPSVRTVLQADEVGANRAGQERGWLLDQVNSFPIYIFRKLI